MLFVEHLWARDLEATVEATAGAIVEQGILDPDQAEALRGVIVTAPLAGDSAGIGSAARIRLCAAMPEEGLEPSTRGL